MIIPKINGTIKTDQKGLDIPLKWYVEANAFTDNVTIAFAQRIQLLGGIITSKKEQGTYVLQICKEKDLAREAYRLSIAEECTRLSASSSEGILLGLTTLYQIMAVEGRLLMATITDAPRYPHRGLSLDVARHFFDAEEVKKIIEQMSLVKMNVLHWHLADDQGWRIASKKYPKLQQVSGDYFTQEELRDVVAFAADRGVEVIPEIEMPGHMSALLAAYPEYSCSGQKVSVATAGGIYPVILCAGKEEVFHLIEDLLDEIVPIFPAKRIHIGGDEAPKHEWRKCPACQKRMQEQGITEIDDLQGYFTARVKQILDKHGKEAICWNESLNAVNMPKDITIQYWTKNFGERMRSYVADGGAFIYSDMFELYLDYPYSMTPLKKLYHTVPMIGKTDISAAKGCTGMEACIWGEHIKTPKRLEELLFPRIFALAELDWSGAGDYKNFTERLEKYQQTQSAKAVHWTDRSWWDPQGSARRKEALSYFAGISEGQTEEQKAATLEATKPGKEFASSFLTKFFKPFDLPYVMKAMISKR
jgi:hexosaminidase